MTTQTARTRRTPLERVLSVCGRLRPGEGRLVGLLMAHGFALMFAYYALKPARESLLLAVGGAQLRSWAVGVVALLLIALIPALGGLFNRAGERRVSRWLTAVFIVSLLGFAVGGDTSLAFSFAFFVWLGIFGVTIAAQFWALATRCFDVCSGERLFPVIAAGVALGALAGALLSSLLLRVLDEHGLMLIAAMALAVSQRVASYIWRLAPPRPPRVDVPSVARGLAVVLRSRYLCLVALSVTLLNGINSLGEYVLARAIIDHVDALVQRGLTPLPAHAIIGVLYGRYYLLINVIGLALQMFVVARLFRHAGVGRAALVMPIAMIAGYLLIGVVPVVSVIYAYLVLENSANYSLHNTVRHTLFLPVDRRIVHLSKTTIDTIFWRCGDLLQIVIVQAGLHLFDLGLRGFVLVNLALAMALLAVTLLAAGRHHRLCAMPRAAHAAGDERVPADNAIGLAEPAAQRRAG